MRIKSSSSRNLHTQKLKYIQNFGVIHPMLEDYLVQKRLKCLNHGNPPELFLNQYRTTLSSTLSQRTDNQLSHQLIKKNIPVIEAPCIQGNIKKIAIRPKKRIIIETKKQKRPNTTNTVIRSRSTQPSIRRKLQYYMRRDQEQDNDLNQQSQLQPKIRRY